MVVVKSKTGEPKIFYIGWSGTEDFRPVVAINGKQAREKFANYHNVNLSSYIRLKRDVPYAIKQMKPIL